MTKRKTAVLFVILGIVIGSLGTALVSLGTAAPGDDRVLIAAAPGPKELTSYRDIVMKVLPAVVSVQAVNKPVSKVGRGNPLPDEIPLPSDLPFSDKELKKYLDELRRRGMAEDVEPFTQFGSGVIIDPKGIVVTNNHVVSGADEVEIILKDGSKFTSKAIHTDPKTDLAVVKLAVSKDLPYVELGDSDAMEIGDRVLAMGAPFGLEGSVTEGIISGKGRNLHMNLYEDYLQTDAAINPGNSGGPLVNMEGKVIGISTAIKSRTGGFQGVGLAIPSNMVKEVATQLAKDGVVKRGYLGIQMQELTAELADKLGLAGQKGQVVGQVFAGSPADKAGLKDGDILVAVNGKALENARMLQRTVELAEIGKPVELTVVHEGKRETVKVTIEAQPADFGLGSAIEPAPRRQPKPKADEPESISLEKLGLQVSDLTAEMADKMGLKEAKGAVITEVEPGSLAQLGGLRRGMVITQAEKQPVGSATELKEALSKASLEEGVLLLIRAPQGGTRYVILKASG